MAGLIALEKYNASLWDGLRASAYRALRTSACSALSAATILLAPQAVAQTSDADAPTGVDTATASAPMEAVAQPQATVAADGSTASETADQAPATLPPTPSISSYQINAGDALEIYVWGEERLQRSLTVLPDGSIAFPLVGQLQVAGTLPQDVERMVRERLRAQYRGEVPTVTVSVAETAGLQFSIMGKVRSPGAFTAGRYLNVLEALSLAGGPAEFANLDSVTLIREQEGEVFSTRLRLGSLFKTGVSARDVERAGIIRILPGDVLIVP
ncbi:polysaccharide biosynthesis/export family protein [Qipengyuania sp. DGS5-3]|uniref:polysaccharide biosynthesis/export family protein n=1 Tax=Qipengyuania sp. DGS5-3 TaxID=3349632 RepID=UPI0036D3ECF9